MRHRNALQTAAALGFAAALTLGLTDCVGPLLQRSSIAVPTTAGNGTAQSTNVGGVVQVSSIESPSGPDMIAACLRIHREWYATLDREHLVPSPGRYASWLAEQQRQLTLVTLPTQCINYATYGAPLTGGMGTGANGFGLGAFGGGFNGRTF